ncbi:MAG: endolytic transglycosylase MltG [bacterium]
MNRLLFFIFTVALFLPIIVLYQIYVPVDKSSDRIKIVNIERGMGVKGIAKLLKAEGVIHGEIAFELLTNLKKSQHNIKAGEYELSPAMNSVEILSKLVRGESIKISFTIPEGYNILQIAEHLSMKGYINKERFIKLTRDKEFISKLGIDAVTLEGYLFPETYYIFKGANEEEIITIMISQLNNVLTQADREQAKRIGFSFHQVLTLASIIEKETKVGEERRLVSAVFHNRLKGNIPLESDPTVIYALLPDFDGNLTKEDLEINSPYNTYRNRGLPPTPIASPGLDAIKSALYPAAVDYLYFVSMNNGTHKFSTTLKEHNGAVLKYQKYHRQL